MCSSCVCAGPASEVFGVVVVDGGGEAVVDV